MCQQCPCQPKSSSDPCVVLSCISAPSIWKVFVVLFLFYLSDFNSLDTFSRLQASYFVECPSIWVWLVSPHVQIQVDIFGTKVRLISSQETPLLNYFQYKRYPLRSLNSGSVRFFPLVHSAPTPAAVHGSTLILCSQHL